MSCCAVALARDDHVFAATSAALSLARRISGLRFGKPGFQRQRVMHKAHQHMTCAQAARCFGQSAKRKSVGNYGTCFGRHQQPRFGGGAGLLGGPGEILTEIDASMAQPRASSSAIMRRS